LSRACLGKIITFSIERHKKDPDRTRRDIKVRRLALPWDPAQPVLILPDDI